MTVKELIDKLSKLDKDKNIHVHGGVGYDVVVSFVGKEREQDFWLSETFDDDDNSLTDYVIR